MIGNERFMWEQMSWPLLRSVKIPSVELLIRDILPAFGCYQVEHVELLAKGSNSINWRVRSENFQVVLRKVIGYVDAGATERSSNLAERLFTLGVLTRRPRPLVAGGFTLLDSTGSPWQVYDFVEGTLLSDCTKVSFKALGVATASLHQAFSLIPKVEFVGHSPYWNVKNIIQKGNCQSFVEGLCPSLIDTDREPSPMHGDLHADNIILTSLVRSIVIYDFDVIRYESNGQYTDIGVLLHRAIRAQISCEGYPEPGQTIGMLVTDFLEGYSSINSGIVDVNMCFQAALLESAKKISACKLGFLGASKVARKTFEANHLCYINELRILIKSIR